MITILEAHQLSLVDGCYSGRSMAKTILQCRYYWRPNHEYNHDYKKSFDQCQR